MTSAIGPVVVAMSIIAACFYVLKVILTGSWTPLVFEFRSPPPGYQSVADFAAARDHAFPALFEEPAPGPVAGTGHLRSILDGLPTGTDVSGVRVQTLHIGRVSGADLYAHLDLPIQPALLAYLRTLSRGSIVTVSGIGHGDGNINIYIYPVHRVDGHEP